MSRILITSCKGGVGKSTVSANLALALARAEKHVLLIDFDLANRTLDLLLGMQDSVIYDICDLMCGRVGCENVLHIYPACPNLAFIGAPFCYEGGRTEAEFKQTLLRLEEVYNFDFILIDTSGGAHESVALSAPACDTGLIVSSQSPAAIRAAEKSGMILDEAKIREQYLIINGFDTEAKSLKERAGIMEMIDRTRTPLLGIVPMDPGVTLLSEKGKSVFDGPCGNCPTAFENIASRLCGMHVPLLHGFRGAKRRRLLGI